MCTCSVIVLHFLHTIMGMIREVTDCDDSLKVSKCLAIVYYILVLINTIARNYKNNYFIEVRYIVRKSVTTVTQLYYSNKAVTCTLK